METVKAVLTWAGVLTAAFLIFSVWHFTVTDGWRKRGLYVWRVRKAWALFNFPLLCRHVGYVGQTGSRLDRDRQHLLGTRYDPPAPWSDLNPRAYPLPCYLPGWEWARLVQEKLWILLLLPVYNVQWNVVPWNLRRIPRQQAYDMRARRQSGGRRLNVGYKLIRTPVTVGLYLVVYWLGVRWVGR